MAKYLIVDKETNDVEYVIKVKRKKDTTVYKMYRSGSPLWLQQARNELILSIEDTGNGITIWNHYDDNLNEDGDFDYAFANEIHLILSVMKKHDKYFSAKHRIIKSK